MGGLGKHWKSDDFDDFNLFSRYNNDDFDEEPSKKLSVEEIVKSLKHMSKKELDLIKKELDLINKKEV